MSSSSFTRSLVTTVQQIVCEVTRYPEKIVTPDADFEEELGIDSVKLAEILAAIRARFQITERLVGNLSEVRTIATIVEHLAQKLRPSKSAEPAPSAPPDAAAAAAPAVDLLPAVIRILASVTRYPEHLLLPDVDLEEELGIELGQRIDVLAALREQLQLAEPLQTQAAAFRKIRTIRELAAAVTRLQRPAEDGRAPRRLPQPPRPTPAAATPLAAPFSGKVFLVTGSGRGLGKRLAQHLGSLGATILVNSFHSRDAGEATTQELIDSGCRAHHLWGSVASPAHIDRMLAWIDRELGGFDGIVSNASNGALARAAELPPERLELAFRTNVVALQLLATRGAALMKRRGGGRIVALSSYSAHQYVEYQSCQGPVKAAVEALVRYLAVELADSNIQINAVCCGPLYGDLLSKYPEGERLIPQWESQTPGNKLCSEQDIAYTVEFLLSDKARMLNGSTVTVDGGMFARGC